MLISSYYRCIESKAVGTKYKTHPIELQTKLFFSMRLKRKQKSKTICKPFEFPDIHQSLILRSIHNNKPETVKH